MMTGHVATRWPVAVTLAGVLVAAALPAGQTPDTLAATGGDITIIPIAHATVALVHGDDVILVDPARFVPGQSAPPGNDLQAMTQDYLARHGGPPPPTPAGEEPVPDLLVSALPIRPEQIVRFRHLAPPTLILVTDLHTDHLDPRVIAALTTPTTRLIVPTAAAGRMLDVQGAETMANGDRRMVGEVTVEAVPMYNLAPDPRLGVVFHPKGRGNGYVLTIGGRRLYVAGDTACTREMRALEQIDVAFVPMNLPYTMSAEDAGACVRAMQPRIVYPYHFFESDPRTFADALRGSGIDVRIRDWYATPGTR